MPKILCMSGTLPAILTIVLLLWDLIFGLVGQEWLAPFKGASKLMDIAYVLCAAGLGYLSWATMKEQR